MSTAIPRTAIAKLGTLLGAGLFALAIATGAFAQDSKATEGLLRLADLYYAGNGVPRDFAKAFELYRRAAEAGSQTAKSQMGEMLVKGEGVAHDIDQGLSLIAGVAEAGSATAYVKIGDLYNEGEALAMQPAKAIRAYTQAAELGSVSALLKLGDIYSSGRFGGKRLKEARAFYEKAAAAGDPYGLFALGRNLAATSPLGSKAAARGFALLQKSEAAGVPYAAPALADSYFYGLGTKPNPKKAMAALAAAAARGNSVAAAKLVEVHRNGKSDGKTTVLRRDRNRAAAILAELAPRMTAADAASQGFLNRVSVAGDATFKRLYGELRRLPAAAQELVVSSLPDENGRFYVFVMQSRLRELGYFKNQPAGQLNSATIRAANDFCRGRGTAYFCAHGPMSGQMAEILSRNF